MTLFLMISFGALLALHLATVVLAGLRYTRPPERTASDTDLPPITLLRPVCGLDAFDEVTLRSSFLLDYPDYNIIFCAARSDDPACALVTKLIANFPHVPAKLMIGEAHITGNPKINNMQKGYLAAYTDHIVMTDSNLLLPHDYLRQLVARWQDDRVGLITSPAAGSHAENLWSAVECAFLNTHQGRWQLAADSIGLGYAQGKTLYGKRSIINAGGGLQALGGDLAEDVAMTKLIRDQGKRVRVAQQLYVQPIGTKSFDQVWARQLRWSLIRRQGFLHLFLLEMVQGPLLPTLICAGLVGSGALPAWALLATLTVWYGAEWALAWLARWPASFRDVAAFVLRDALIPVIWAATWTQRGLIWRGNRVSHPAKPSRA
jgi:ceramide glucosyltransferase